MFKKALLVLIFISGMLMSAVSFSGCGSKSDKVAEGIIQEKMEVYTNEESSADESGLQQKATASGTTKFDAPTETEQIPAGQSPEKIPSKIIKTADISYQVETFTDSRKAILAIVKKYNALVSGENQTNDGYRIRNTMTIRVDAPAFDSLVEELMTEAIYIEHKTINAEDVTEEFVDLTARMKSKKEVEAQYSEILKKARTINEILEVTEYLRAIREEIESVEGRLKYLNDRVAYSTITLTYYEQLDVVSRQPARTFGSRMGEAFSWGWNGLVGFFLGIIYLWPLWLIMGLTAWLVYRMVKRSSRRRKAAKEAK